ncbi:MAG: hypothetical protein M1817_006253 [Caeruleum heppii]|nr:MAG: hypothetical protein M1817_006253 [Caeruleum heppii]
MSESNPPPARTKDAQGAEPVKHRRTRSGCYTCRTRRVKCDEARPICERCRKGARDCSYPEPKTPGTKKARAAKAAKAAKNPTHSAADPSKVDKTQPLEPIEDEDETSDASSDDSIVSRPKSRGQGPLPAGSQSPRSKASSSTRHTSETPSLTTDKSPSPCTEGSRSQSRPTSALPKSKSRSRTHTVSSPASAGKTPWAHLSSDIQFYLHYHQTHISAYYYSFKLCSGDFLKSTFLEIAVNHEPLLYAVVGFSAYHYAVTREDGKLGDFIGYYNNSLSLLRQSLAKKQKHTEATLLTILQLATAEEYLADWVNLLNHQKAAYEILTELYTPATVMQTQTQRVILDWYTRFDLIGGLVSGYETVLGRDWFLGCQQHYVDQTDREPDVVMHRIDEAIARHRTLAMEMTVLFSKKARGDVSHQTFLLENSLLQQRFRSWYEDMDPKITDPNCAITRLEGIEMLEAGDEGQPYTPGMLFEGPLWTMNFTFLSFYGTDLMHKFKTALALQTQPSAELQQGALKVCRLFEAIEQCPTAPPGSIMEAQSALAIAALFIPKDETHLMWARRKFSVIERMGYIYPSTFRKHVASIWGIADVEREWLPVEHDGMPPIIRSIRAFVEECTTNPRDEPATDLKDMKAIFSSLTLDESGTGGLSPMGPAPLSAGVLPGPQGSMMPLGTSGGSKSAPVETGASLDGGSLMFSDPAMASDALDWDFESDQPWRS